MSQGRISDADDLYTSLDVETRIVVQQRTSEIKTLMRRELPRWVREYPCRAAQNEGYATHGVLVPLHEFEKHAEVVLNV